MRRGTLDRHDPVKEGEPVAGTEVSSKERTSGSIEGSWAYAMAAAFSGIALFTAGRIRISKARSQVSRRLDRDR